MTEVAKTPVHLWIVGVVSLLWNSIGASDYTMTQMKNEAWLSGFTGPQRAYFDAIPGWADALWAVGIWGSVLGSVLLLARSRHAVTAFIASLVGLAGSTFYQFGMNFETMKSLFGNIPIFVNIAVWVILIATLLYARKQVAAGVLR